jgi:hypothetical protein
MYISIYENLCAAGKDRKHLYKKGSNLHKHHIVPRHSGGTDADHNFTYLNVREHILAHFLLWKIHRMPNDLRAMHMLGANLTSEHRKLLGEWCRDNKIGFHSDKFTHDEKSQWRMKGLQKQRDEELENSFYYWSTEEGRRNRASLGGKVGGKKQAELKLGIHNPEMQKRAASLGGKAHKGKKCMYRPGDTSFKRVPRDMVDEFLSLGYVFGSPIRSLNKKA